ncbi:unnamed protein product [Alopecurus aequalis]
MQERLPFCAILPRKGSGGLMSANQPARCTMLMLLSLLLISRGVGKIHCSPVPDNTTDRLWLLDFKAVIKDPGQNLKSWNNRTPHCQWKGVHCRLHRKHIGRVTALNLARQNLHGQIAPSLGNLTFLRELDLYSNNFFGQLPTFNRLRRLQTLDLGNNKLQRFNPDALKNCSNLQYLHLSANSMAGPLPPDIGSLSSLLYLYLDTNNFTGIIPPSLHNITNLIEISISSNQLQGSIPEELGQLPNMTWLNLGRNRLSGRIPATILNHSVLELLDLNSNFLQMKLPSNIGDTLPNLGWLYLDDNMFHGPIPASLGNSSYLQIMSFVSNSFTGQVPSSLGKLSYLYYLNLETNKLEANDSESWEFLDALSNCSGLQTLSLSDNQLQGTIPNSVGKLSPGLQYLLLDTNNLYGTVPESIGNLTGLLKLSLAQNNLVGPIP